MVRLSNPHFYTDPNTTKIRLSFPLYLCFSPPSFRRTIFELGNQDTRHEPFVPLPEYSAHIHHQQPECPNPIDETHGDNGSQILDATENHTRPPAYTLLNESSEVPSYFDAIESAQAHQST